MPKSRLKTLLQQFDAARFIKYLVGGSIYFWVGLGLFALLYSGLHWNWWASKILSDIVGWTLNYLVQRLWAFEDHISLSEMQHAGRYVFIETIGFILDYGIVGGIVALGWTPYIGMFISGAFFTFWLLIFALLGLYNSNIYEKRFAEVGRLFIGSFIGLMFVIFWNFLSLNPIFPAKLVPIYGFIFGFIFLVIFRNIARLIRTELFSFGVGLTRVLIIGSTPMTNELVTSLRASKQSGYQVVGVVARDSTIDALRVLGYKDFQTYTEAAGASELHGIIQTELYKDDSRNTEILEYAQEHHINYRFVPGNSELFVGNIDVELFRNAIPVINVRQTALFGWGRIVKRLFDIVVGSILLVCASPFMFIICLLYLFDHGDPIFSQKRLSRFGNTIRLYKFRTQYHAYHRMSPEEGFAKMNRPDLAKQFRDNGDYLEHDPRISRLGRFLRQTSLDELPQLINVVKGDISLVGPRPLEPFEMEKYAKKHSILSVKTGLTGLAVVSGRRDIPFEERRKLDIYYVQNWSFWFDITILLKTIRIVLSRSGAK